MLEEHTYFCVLYLTWQRDTAWADLGPAVFGQILQPFRSMVQVLARSSTLRDLHGQVRCFCSAFSAGIFCRWHTLLRHRSYGGFKGSSHTDQQPF